MQFQLQPGTSQQITLQFQEPSGVNSSLLPIYSGFIYATNQVNGEVAQMFCKHPLLSFLFVLIFL
jgi:hypothetical protein